MSSQSREENEKAQQMVRDHYDLVYRFMLTLTRNSDDAADLTQQTFLRACKSLDSFRNESGVHTWLSSIAYREFVRWRRKRTWLPLPKDRPCETSPFENSLAAQDLANALTKLPWKLREAFLLSELQELSIAEVASLQKVPEGTVKSRLFTARNLLRTLLGPGLGENNERKQDKLALEPRLGRTASDVGSDV